MPHLITSGQSAGKPGNSNVDRDPGYELEGIRAAHVTTSAKSMDSPSTFTSEFRSDDSDAAQGDREIGTPRSIVYDEKTQVESFRDMQLVLLAISLSLVVFLISLDRVIITTVSITGILT